MDQTRFPVDEQLASGRVNDTPTFTILTHEEIN